MEERKIFTLMAEDNWFKVIEPVAFFTTKEKAEAYKHEAQKDKKRWKHCRLFVQEYVVDRKYERMF